MILLLLGILIETWAYISLFDLFQHSLLLLKSAETNVYNPIKKVTAWLATLFVGSRCRGIMGRMAASIELCDEVEAVNGFSYLADRLNASDGCEVAVIVRVRIGWVRFRKCGELLLGNRFPLKMKGSKVYHCCIRSAIHYRSKAW